MNIQSTQDKAKFFRNNNVSSIFILSLLTILVIQYAYYILQYPIFSFSDEHEFIPYLMGEGPYSWRFSAGIGRFYPLSLLEYFPFASAHFLTIEQKMFLMYCVNVFKIGGIVYLTYFCLCKFANKYLSFMATCTMMGLFIKYAFLTQIFTLIIPEFSLAFLEILFLTLYFTAIKKDSSACWCAAIIVAIFSFFFKETAFFIYLVFCSARLLLNYKAMSHREKIACSLLLCSSLIYLACFYFMVYSQRTGNYNDITKNNIILNLLEMCRVNLVFIPACIIFIARLIQVFILKKKSLIFDALISASVLYPLPIMWNGLAESYYFTTSLIFFIYAATGFAEEYSYLLNKLKLSNIYLCLAVWTLLICGNFYSINICYQLNLKKIIFPLLNFINTLHKDKILVSYYVAPNKSLDRNFEHWQYFIANKFNYFYFKHKDFVAITGDINPKPDEIILYSYHTGFQPPDNNNSIKLDFVFADALINKDGAESFCRPYHEFYNESRKRSVNTKRLKGISASWTRLKKVCDEHNIKFND